MPKTIEDLEDRARLAIERDEEMIHSVAGRRGELAVSIKSATWFRVAVMHHLANHTETWRHLADEVDDL